ncbi:dihydrofolate reductase [[Clostridium] polysaccharolyticum]|jgi:dihydrofolate reductase|uniref:dihydrofolate reductase n=1 Tax=[Clostridium] polysaccharolyticum TaxID=29364 RepID=A0A1I0DYE2_9FIRM|nr:dihydrofolate reductase [[Clostridium] polysaccharolyticum]SET37297.1 dihydrofolate reductase [[Clostridium] polysaccharolyticum]
MKLIAAVDSNWGIGLNNQLLVNIPSDKRYFKALTEHQVVVMGRKTYESLPGKRALENRVNIILTKAMEFQAKGFLAAHSLEELFGMLRQFQEKEVFVIGGQTVYEQLHPYCEEAYITKIEYAYHADRFCPNLDQQKGWTRIGISEEETYYDLEYYFCKYKNHKFLRIS